MFDAALQSRLQPALRHLAAALNKTGLRANHVTIGGFVLGVIACVGVATGLTLLAVICWGLNRLADGIDGALARHQGPTRLGGYLDILLDMIIYGGVVMAHAVAFPDHAVAAAFLLFSFIASGTSFLAWAILAAQGETTPQPVKKSFFYQRGLAEGMETIIALTAIILWPNAFVWIAGVFGALCWATAAQRVMMARLNFRP